MTPGKKMKIEKKGEKKGKGGKKQEK